MPSSRTIPRTPESEDKRVPGIPKTGFNLGWMPNTSGIKGSLIGRYYGKIYNDSDNSEWKTE
jgi:hypothetical protein